MNKPQPSQSLQRAVDRRTLVVAFSGLASGLAAAALLPSLSSAAENGSGTANSAVRFNAWVTIATDGIISIASPAMEMGQGSMTSLPLILAEELDAEWSQVKIVTAPPSDSVFGNPKFFDIMYTAGSSTVTGYYDELRLFGAEVRRALIDNAARHWQVPAGELTTRPSEVVHRQSGRQMTYGISRVLPSRPLRRPASRLPI
jgi:isoquinoline 1-oxidoreductase beta subunit